MSSDLPLDKEDLEKLATDVFKNLTLISLLFFGIDLLVLPGYVDFYIGKERLLYLLFSSAYIYIFLYVRGLERKDTIRFKRVNQVINYAFYALIASAIFSYIPHLFSSAAAVPIIATTLALGLATFYLRRSKKIFSHTLHSKRTGRSYVIDHKTIYRYTLVLFYAMLLLGILNIIMHWYPLASLGSQVTKITIAIGILSIYINREQIYRHFQTIQELDRNDLRFKIVSTFATYLNREWLTPFTQCAKEFDRNDPRHERVNHIISHTFLVMVLVLAIHSNGSLLLPKSLKVPIALIALILAAATYYLKGTKPKLFPLVKDTENLENKHGPIYRWINDAISYAFYLLLILTLLYYLPWLLDEFKTELMVVATIFGGFTFYLNKDKIEDIEEETIQEGLAEKQRKMVFAEKYPRIDRVWGLSLIGKWVYKEGKLYALLLIFIIINAFFIRYDNIDMLPLQNDEFLTLKAVKYILSDKFSPIDCLAGSDNFASTAFYSRAWIYSLLTALTVKIMGSNYPYSYSSLRLFSVIVGTFSLLFFYLVLRHYKINKVVSLATIYSYSIFFIFVYYSRVSRMYVLLLPLFYLNLIVIYNLFEKVKNSNESIISDIKKHFIQIILIILILLISINIHKNSLTLGIPFYLLCFYYYNYSKKMRFLFVISSTFLLGLLFIHYFNILEIIPSWYFNTSHDIHYKFIKYSYSYVSGKEISLIFFMSLLANILLKDNNINKLIKGSYFIFISILFFFTFLANGNTFHNPRYIIFLYILYNFIIIYSLFYLSKIIFSNKKSMSIIVFILLFVLIISKIQVAGLCYNSGLTESPISHESRIFTIDRWNYNYDEAYSAIKYNIQPDNIIVGRVLYGYYLDKYEIKNENYILTNKTKIPLIKIKEHDVIFVTHPQLIYHSYEIDSNQYIYNYLYNNKNKSIIYKSQDGKTVIYKIESY